MVPSRPRSTNSNWSNDRCLVVPNFRCYGNACSMRPDLYRDLRQISFLCSSCFLLLLARPLSPIQAHTAYPVFSLACGKQAHLFWGRACLIDFHHLPNAHPLDHHSLKQATTLSWHYQGEVVYQRSHT